MVTIQQLNQMLDETIEELQKPDAALQFSRYRQLIAHRARLEARIRHLTCTPVWEALQ